MEEYKKEAQKIPWSHSGRPTIFSELGLSLLPIGIYQNELPKISEGSEIKTIGSENKEYINYLMNIKGTGIQAGNGKIVTCAHVIKRIRSRRHFQGIHPVPSHD
jgi:hypothetical protein